MKASDLQKEIDRMARELRLLDNSLQEREVRAYIDGKPVDSYVQEEQ